MYINMHYRLTPDPQPYTRQSRSAMFSSIKRLQCKSLSDLSSLICTSEKPLQLLSSLTTTWIICFPTVKTHFEISTVQLLTAPTYQTSQGMVGKMAQLRCRDCEKGLWHHSNLVCLLLGKSHLKICLFTFKSYLYHMCLL